MLCHYVVKLHVHCSMCDGYARSSRVMALVPCLAVIIGHDALTPRVLASAMQPLQGRTSLGGTGCCDQNPSQLLPCNFLCNMRLRHGVVGTTVNQFGSY